MNNGLHIFQANNRATFNRNPRREISFHPVRGIRRCHGGVCVWGGGVISRSGRKNPAGNNLNERSAEEYISGRFDFSVRIAYVSYRIIIIIYYIHYSGIVDSAGARLVGNCKE